MELYDVPSVTNLIIDSYLAADIINNGVVINGSLTSYEICHDVSCGDFVIIHIDILWCTLRRVAPSVSQNLLVNGNSSTSFVAPQLA